MLRIPYVEKADSDTRRAAQTAIYRLLNALTRMLAPILAFTAEEIWSYMPHGSGDDPESVLFNDIPKSGLFKRDEALLEKWDRILKIREDVNKALELARTARSSAARLKQRLRCTAPGNGWISSGRWLTFCRRR